METNLLVVLADQFRGDCLGVAGNPDVRTPNLDQLASDGVYFPNSYCVAPLCTPSRYTLLTGLLPAQHGVHGNNQGLRTEHLTLPERARTVGTRSTAVGKMHFTPTYMTAGFDRMRLCEQNGDGRLIDDYHRDLISAGLVDGVDLIDQRDDFRARANAAYWDSFGAATSDLPEPWHSTTWTAQQAIDLIDPSWATGGQLMYLSFVKPHHPFDPPTPWDRDYDPADLTILPGWTPEVPDHDTRRGYFDNGTLTEDSLRRIMALYYGSISHLDHHLGRVLNHLRAIGAYDNTMIIFTSDHGEYLGYHHMVLKSGPMYDPVMQVPMIMKPGSAVGRPAADSTTSTRDDRLVSGADLVPTALAGLGIPVPDELPGHDLADQTWTRDVVLAQSGTDCFMARSTTAKLISSPSGGTGFDLRSDPLELSPLHTLDPAAFGHLASDIDALRDLGPETAHSRERGERHHDRSPDDPQERLRQFDHLLSDTHPWLR